MHISEYLHIYLYILEHDKTLGILLDLFRILDVQRMGW